MYDTHTYDGRIDRDCFEESPSCDYREVAYVMHAADAHLVDAGGRDRLEDVLESIEESEIMRRESTTTLEVSA